MGSDPPEEYWRCSRTGTPNWRCKERAVGGKKLCEKHRLYFARMPKEAPPAGAGATAGAERRSMRISGDIADVGRRGRMPEVGNGEGSCGDGAVGESKRDGGPRKRGRAKGSKNNKRVGDVAAEEVVVVSDGNGSLCRNGKRGRPKGSKDKEKRKKRKTEEEDASVGIAEDQGVSGLETLRVNNVGHEGVNGVNGERSEDGQGKNEILTRKRGRPKGSKNRKPATHNIRKNHEAAPADDVLFWFKNVGHEKKERAHGENEEEKVEVVRRKTGLPKGSKYRKCATAKSQVVSEDGANVGYVLGTEHEEGEIGVLQGWPEGSDNWKPGIAVGELEGKHRDFKANVHSGFGTLKPKRARGRPKGSKNKMKILPDKDNWKPGIAVGELEGKNRDFKGNGHSGYGTLKPQRARGRPKGSKNKRIVLPDKDNWKSGIADGELENKIGDLKGNGHSAFGTLKPKRARGRPKGSKNKRIILPDKDNCKSGTAAGELENQIRDFKGNGHSGFETLKPRRVRGRPRGSKDKRILLPEKARVVRRMNRERMIKIISGRRVGNSRSSVSCPKAKLVS